MLKHTAKPLIERIYLSHACNIFAPSADNVHKRLSLKRLLGNMKIQLIRVSILASILLFLSHSAFAVAPTVVSAIPDTTVNEDNPDIKLYRNLNDVFDDTEDDNFLTFSIQSNSNPGLVTVSINEAPIVTNNVTTDCGNATALTHSHTVSGDNRLLVVSIQLDGGLTVDTVKYAGQALTRDTVLVQSGGKPTVEVWHLTAPPLGANTVRVVQLGGDKVTIAAVSYTGVHQTTPIDGLAAAEGLSGTASVTITSETDDLVQDASASIASGAPTFGGGQTERWNIEMGCGGASGHFGVGSTEPGAASVDMTWSLAESKEWVIAGFNINLKPVDSLNLSFAADSSGTATIVVRATDPGTDFVEDTFVVTVNGTPTVASAIPDTTVNENIPPINNYRDLNSVFNDVEDGSALAFTIQSNSNPGLLTPTIDSDSALDLSLVAESNGVDTIVIRATDVGTLFVQDTLVVTVVEIISVAVSNSTFPFGTRLLNSWLSPDSSFITNDGTGAETFKGKISQFTTGSNNWAVSATANGADSVRAQWSTTSNTGPWTDISAYDTDFTIATGVAVNDSVTFWFQIETPTSTSSYNQYSSTLTVTAE